MGIAAGREANGATLADVMIAVVGVAVGFVVEPVRAETSRVVQVCGFLSPVSQYTSLYWTLARFAQPVVLGLVLALVVRRARYGGLPRAGEWLAVVTLLLLLDPAIPGETQVLGPATTRPMTYAESPSGALVPTRHVRPTVVSDLDPFRVPAALVLLATAALALAAIAASWVVLRLQRRGLPAWVALLLLTALGWAWLRVPIRLNPTEVVRSRFSWLDFTPKPLPTALSGPALDWFIEGRYALGRWPVGLFAALAAAAEARDLSQAWNRRDRRRWTEWAAAAIALVLAGAWAWDELILRSEPALLIRVCVFSAWIAALAVPAWLIVGWFVDRDSGIRLISGWPMDSGRETMKSVVQPGSRMEGHEAIASQTHNAADPKPG
jgi:hypothetical protein